MRFFRQLHTAAAEDGNQQPEAHQSGDEEAEEADNGDFAEARGDAGENNQRGADDQGGEDDGVDDAVADPFVGGDHFIEAAVFELDFGLAITGLFDEGADFGWNFVEEVDEIEGGVHKIAGDAFGIEAAEMDFLDEGASVFADAEIFIEASSDAFDGGHRFHHGIEMGFDGQAMIGDDFDELVEHLTDIDFIKRDIQILVDHIGEVALETVMVGLVFVVGQLKEGADHFFIFAVDNAGDEIGELFAFDAADPSHHAKVEIADDIIFENIDIARVRVGVEKAVFKNLLHNEVGAIGGDFLEIVPSVAEGVEVGDLDAVDILHGQHALGGEIAKDLGDVDGFIVDEHPGEMLHVGGFHGIVDFLFDGAGEFLDNFRGTMLDDFLDMAFGEDGEMEHDFEIDLDGLDDAGALNLDGDFFAILHSRTMHLADRGGGVRFLFEMREEFFRFFAGFGFDDFGHFAVGKDGDLVLQFGKLGDIFKGDEVGTGGEDLAEFDEGGAEFLEDFADAFGGGEVLDLFELFIGDHFEADFEILFDFEAVDEIAEAVFKDDIENLFIAIEMAVSLTDDADFSNT